jgi:MYXO-CTERM domain-containing protein
MTTTLSDYTPGLAAVSMTLALAGLTASAQAQTTYSASDNIFAPGTWTWSQKGANPASTGFGTQSVDGFAAGVNAWTSTTTPNGTDNTWTVSIFEGFSYNPSSASGEPAGVVVSFDSRWIGNKFSGIGPALRQGSNVWAGFQPTGQSSHNSSSWASYSYSGWSTLLAGTSLMPAPDFSAGAAPIFFGFYQRNAGTGPNQSQFSNFSVVVTVPAPAAMALVGIAAPFAGRRRRSR